MTVRNADIAQEAHDKTLEVRQEAGLRHHTLVHPGARLDDSSKSAAPTRRSLQPTHSRASCSCRRSGYGGRSRRVAGTPAGHTNIRRDFL